MRITQLSIENFKGFGDYAVVPLAPMTLLFGPNSAGKSSIIQAASYLHAVLTARALNPSSTVLGRGTMDLGGFKQVVHRGDLDRALHLGLEVAVDEDLVETAAGLRWQNSSELMGHRGAGLISEVADTLAEIETLNLSLAIEWSAALERPVIRKVTLHANGHFFWETECSSDAKRKELTRFSSSHPLCQSKEFVDLLFDSVLPMYQDRERQQLLVGLPQAFDALPEWRQPFNISEVIDGEETDALGRLIWQSLLELLLHGPLELVSQALERAVYIGPLRAIPNRQHQPQFDRTSWADGLAAWDRLMEEPSLLRDLNKWLGSDGAGMNTGYQVVVDRFRELDERSRLWGLLHSASPNEHRGEIVDELQNCVLSECLRLKDVERDVLVYPQDVGVGISQAVPVMVAALDQAVSLAFVEQPELHIHPRLQVELGELLLCSAKQAGKSMILETHSEHIILRQLRLIEEGKYQPGDLSVLYVQPKNGTTSVERMLVTEQGDFEHDWPDGFFDERERELLG